MEELFTAVLALLPIVVVNLSQIKQMKLTRTTLGLLSWIGFISILVVPRSTPAQSSAPCIQADIGVQYNISGSRQPTERINDVDFASQGNCQGNVSITTGVQGNEGGTGRVSQRRVVRHRFRDNTGGDRSSRGSTIQIKVNPTIDVYNAAEHLR